MRRLICFIIAFILLVSLLFVSSQYRIEAEVYGKLLFEDASFDKIKAASFLFKNAPYHVGAKVSSYWETEFLNEYHEISEKYKNGNIDEYRKRVDSLVLLRSKQHEGQYFLDLDILNSEYLVNEINITYDAWKNNPYVKKLSFEDYCEYVLPYRRNSKLPIDTARINFNRRHKSFFEDSVRNVFDAIDSILFSYHEIKHSRNIGKNIPIITTKMLEQIKQGLCEDKCNFNSMLLSSLGFPVCIDFVPAWGNRNNNHTWNSVIIDGKTYPFEPFWDSDRWKYKRIYNNCSIDSIWGLFKLAKVYRRTYEVNDEIKKINERLSDDRIPKLFKDIHVKDVSSSYFKGVDVAINLSPEIKDDYLFLCVYNFGEWVPVHFARNHNGKILFTEMGKGTVYLAARFENNKIEPVSAPFILNDSGGIDLLAPKKSNVLLKIKHNVGSPLYYGNRPNASIFNHSILLGSKDSTFVKTDTLLKINLFCGIYEERFQVKSTDPIRYLRFCLQDSLFAVSELRLISSNNEMLRPLSMGCNCVSLSRNQESIDYICDGYYSTGFKMKLSDTKIDFDLKSDQQLKEILITPYFECRLNDSSDFELYYWDNLWISLGKKRGSLSHVEFENVPENALLLLRNIKGDGRPGARPFIYIDNQIKWL